MKSIKSIEQEMTNIQVSLSTEEHKKSVISRMKKRHSFLLTCKMYLKTNPTTEFIHKEKERLITRINLINAGYTPDKRLIDNGFRKEEQKEHADYNKIMGLGKCKDQLKAISFLIS